MIGAAVDEDTAESACDGCQVSGRERRRARRGTWPDAITVTTEATVLRALARTERSLEHVSDSMRRLALVGWATVAAIALLAVLQAVAR